MVESGTQEIYDQFEKDMMRRVCEKMIVAIEWIYYLHFNGLNNWTILKY